MVSANDNVVIVLFVMEGCGACEQFKPIFEAGIQRQRARGIHIPVHEVDISMQDAQVQQLADRLQIKATPTLAILRRGPGAYKVEGPLNRFELADVLAVAERVYRQGQ
jgi:thiol-disulfide isomerase/thioredoxin